MTKQAVIIAGGFGTRLRPYTDAMPKPMVPVLGKPLLEWHIEQFKKYGVQEIFMTLHYLPQVIMDYFGDGERFGVTIKYFIEASPLGTAGGLKRLEPFLDQEFFMVNGDVFSLVDYSKMEAAWRALPCEAVGIQRVGKADQYADADVVELDADGKFSVIHAKPHHERYEDPYRMRGIYLLKKNILSHLFEGQHCEFNSGLLSKAIAAGELFYGYRCEDYSKGIDTIEKLREVERYLRSRSMA